MKAVKYILALILVLTLTVPAMAGNGPGGPGGGGGETEIPDTGELYGDLYVILRDEDGLPIWDITYLNGVAYPCIQPLSGVEVYGDDGALLYDINDPIQLLTYIDEAGDVVECELTEEMAAWVQTVDFGRLNLGRSPESVLAHAFDEAVKKMNTATAMKLDPAGRLVLTLPDAETGVLVDKTIDAPAENLALYIEMMTDGDWITEVTAVTVKGGRPDGKGPPEGDGPSTEPRPVLCDADGNGTVEVGELEIGTALLLDGLGFAAMCDSTHTATALTDPELLLAASLLAAAADKAGSITLDKVVYINSIYGINQVGTLVDLVDGKTYFDFSRTEEPDIVDTIPYAYNRTTVYGNRGSTECDLSWVYVLQPITFDVDTGNVLTWGPECMPMIKDAEGNDVFTIFPEPLPNALSNVRAFTQAADDALKTINYIHNFKIPVWPFP